LIDIGNNQYVLPNGRIAERLDNPEINQFYLESSNVNLADSMSEMILTQRAYSMNTKVLQSTDEMMQRINEFKQ
jgi:flagellar basal-body rod protein FlgG